MLIDIAVVVIVVHTLIVAIVAFYKFIVNIALNSLILNYSIPNFNTLLPLGPWLIILNHLKLILSFISANFVYQRRNFIWVLHFTLVVVTHSVQGLCFTIVIVIIIIIIIIRKHRICLLLEVQFAQFLFSFNINSLFGCASGLLWSNSFPFHPPIFKLSFFFRFKPAQFYSYIELVMCLF